MGSLDRQSLEKALDQEGPVPLDRIVELIELFGAVLVTGDVLQDVRALMATPRYAPPEKGLEDATSDQFSLAAMAYQLLTGRPPFGGEVVRPGLPEPMRAVRPEISAELESVVFRGLARERRDRYPSLQEFVSSFRGAAAPRAEAREPDEATMVSTVPFDIAQLLRPAPSAMDHELTVVGRAAAQDEPTVISPAEHSERPAAVPAAPPAAPRMAARAAPVAGTVHTPHTRTIQLHRRWGHRRPTNAAVTVGGLVLALGAGVLWRVAARPTPAPAAAGIAPVVAPRAQPAAPPVPIARPAAPAPAPAVATAAPREPPALTATPPPPGPAVVPAVAERPVRVRARTHARPLLDDNAAPDSGQAVAPKNCRISVGSYPWSHVWIDGADTGLQTPIVNLALACGRHRLQFKRPDIGVDQIESVSLTEGDALKRQYDLRGLNVDD